jgi:hypothetical protein
MVRWVIETLEERPDINRVTINIDPDQLDSAEE